MRLEVIHVKCPSCDGSGQEYSGVEHMGAREVIGCGDCAGTGFVDPNATIESLIAQVAQLTQDLAVAREELALHDKEDVVIETAFNLTKSQLAVANAKIEEARAWVGEYYEGDYFVSGQIRPSFYAGVDWAHKSLLAILSRDTPEGNNG